MTFLSEEQKKRLHQIASEIVADGKGILAADESEATVGKRFKDIKLENIEENRKWFREMLFDAEGLEKYVGGVILHEETFSQSSSSGASFIEMLTKKGIKVGIKLDKGLEELPFTHEEQTTKGLDGLGARVQDFAKRGATFAKWRCVLKISETHQTPSEYAIDDVAHVLAKYAVACQAHGLVPIVEPEVLIDGTHSIQESARVCEKAFAKVYEVLRLSNVYLEGTLLKPNMITPGMQSGKPIIAEEVAKYTMMVLSRTVPPAVPGITFLSGGQSELDATKNLHAINAIAIPRPWKVTFSFARALQNSCTNAWAGKKENLPKAREILLKRARFNSLAAQGKYDPKEDFGEDSQKSLYVEKHVY